jgi:hypothetical protein
MPFIYPNLDEERGEFERAAQEEPELSLERMWDVAQSAPLVSLDDDSWAALENTWSWGIADLATAKRYGEEHERDVNRIIRGFENNETIPAPIVVIKPDGKKTLIAGNNRLSVARALGVRPRVLLVALIHKSDNPCPDK